MIKRILPLGILLFLFHCTQAQICSKTQLPANLQNGLVAFYPFCGNANDASGNGNNGTVNGAVLSTDRFGNNNSSYLFDGNDDISITHNQALNITGDLTISAWFNSYGPPPTFRTAHTIVSKRGIDNYTIVPYQLSINYQYGLTNDYKKPLFASATGGKFQYLQSKSDVSNDVWSHLVATISSNNLKIYLNGNLVLDTIVDNSLRTDNIANLLIGSAGRTDTPAERFVGKLDEIFLYNRALDCNEITQLFNSGGNSIPELTIFTINPFQDSTSICGSSYTIDPGNEFYSYSWNTGSQKQTLSTTLSGNYKVTVTNAAGCKASDSTLLILNNGDILSSDTSICAGQSVTLLAEKNHGSLKYIGTYLDHDYFIDTIPRKWTDARDYAANQGMMLWKIDDLLENLAVYNFLPYKSDINASYWTGLYQNRTSTSYSEPAGGWMWMDGTPMTFTNWLAGEPNNAFGGGIEEDYVAVKWVNVYNDKWNDLPNDVLGLGYKTYGIVEAPKRSWLWSTGQTTPSITVTPSITTKYKLTVTDNLGSCTDSVTVTVTGGDGFNPLQDTLRLCGDSVILDASAGFQSYSWDNGATTQKITAKSGGKYAVNVTNTSGCSSSDSTYVSLVKAKIIQRDTTICKGSSITLSVDSSSWGSAAQNKSMLPIGLQNGLVAYYPFNGNANDASGNGNNGTMNGTTFAADRYGSANSSGNFNGTNSWISIPNTSSLNPSNVTINAWIRINPDDNNKTYCVLTKTDANGQPINLSYHMFLFNTNSLVGAYGTGACSVVSGNQFYGIPNSYKTGEWSMFTETISANGEVKIYINGVLNNTFNGSPYLPCNNSNSHIRIGKSYDGDPAWFKGNIDDIGIWGRTLNETEVIQLYNNQSVSWSTGATTNSITVSPTQTTKYIATVFDGVTTCSDSVTVTVIDPIAINTLSDTTRVCGTSTSLSAGNGFDTYTWNTGETTQSISPTASGFYKVTVTKNGCSVSDSTYLRIIYANILQKDTTICKGNSLKLLKDTSGMNNIQPRLLQSQNVTFKSPWQINWDVNPQKQYKVVISGTYGMANDSINLDAAYYMTTQQPYNAGFYGFIDVFKILDDKPKRPFPDQYNSNHVYNYYYYSNDGQINFSFSDFDYAGNSGMLTLELYEIPTNHVTTQWSTGETSDSIVVSPGQTTKYFLTISDGVTSCGDSITVTVVDPGTFNTLSDTTRVCGTSTSLSAGNGFDTYTWNTGETTQSISPTTSGFYKVTGTKSGCSVSDSTYLSLVKAKIIQRDTTICKGSSITLSVDSSSLGSSAQNNSMLPTNLQNGLVAYYPLNGNANDESGNGNNGIINGATLTTDRFGTINSALEFNGTNYITGSASKYPAGNNARTVSVWFYSTLLNQYSGAQLGTQLFGYGGGSCGTSFIGYFSRTSFDIQGHCGASIQSAASLGFTNPSWHNISITYDGLISSIYLDGKKIDSKSNSFNTNVINTNFYFGLEVYPDGLIAYTQDLNQWLPFNGKLDDIGVWSRALTPTEIQQLYNMQSVSWSTGSNSSSITVSPNQTTKYYVTVGDGITSCQDSITVTVNDIGSFNPLQDTLRVCGDSVILDAGSGYSTYNWSNGATSQKINAKSGGKYVVNVSNASGCTTTDSTLVSIVKAKIIQRDTTICKGSSIILSIDSTLTGSTVCNASELPLNLRNGLVAYYPFCGNANDASGNGNNGTVNGATLSSDRFGNQNSTYAFNGLDNFIEIPSLNNMSYKPITYSAWVNPNSLVTGNYALGGGMLIVGRDQSGYYQQGSILLYNYPGIGINNSFSYYVGNPVDPTTVNSYFTPNTNNWYLVTMTYASNDSLIWYINGQRVRSNLFSFVSNANIPFKIGAGTDVLISKGRQFWNGKIDDVGIWNRALSDSEVQSLFATTNSVSWSTGATSSSITVSPTQTTKYYLTVSDGITSCQDSITVTVNDIDSFNPLQDTLRVCGDSVILDAGSGYSTYNWSNGATSQKITVKSGGKYVVNVSNASGCTTADSTLVSIVKAKIIQRDTTICKGSSITLSIDSTLTGSTACNASELPLNLRNGLVAYYPFCGNANDASGNGNNGKVNGPVLSTDRFGNSNSSYYFDGINDWIEFGNLDYISTGNVNEYTISFWINPEEIKTFASSSLGSLLFGDEIYQNNGVIFSLHNDYGFNSFNPGKIAACYCLPPLKNWVNYTVTQKSTGLDLYINGNYWGHLTDKLNNETNTVTRIGYFFQLNDRPFKGKIDDLFIYNRSLSENEIQQLNKDFFINWSNNATTTSINVTPTQTTKYYVTVSDGITSCQDSITVTVNDISSFNPIQDTLRVCGDSVILDAGSGYSTYNWSNGSTTQKITVKSGGKYSINVINASGCTATDSTLVSIVKAKIIQRDTTICKGSSIILSIDSTLTGSTVCNASELPMNLRNGLIAYYPFCGNANDVTGNGNNGIVYGATLTTDRFGNTNAAYSFNGTSNYIQTGSLSKAITNKTISAWVKLANVTQTGGGLAGLQTSNGSIFDVMVYNETSNGWGFGSNNFTRTYWTGVKETSSTWVMLTATYENNLYKLYRNGILIGTTTQYPITTFATSGKINIGIRHDGGQNRFLNGIIDDVYVYDRVMTPNEIQSLFKITSVNWSNGSTNNSITVTPTQTTKYYVTVSDGITSCRDSVTVTIADLDTSITALDPTSVCSTGGNVRLQAGVANAYQWLKDGAVVSGATARLYSATQTGSYRVVVTNTTGCSDTSRAISIILDPKPLPNFTINNNAQCLTENGFIFTNTSTIPSGTMTYKWSLGDNSTATTTDVSKTYASAGTFNIKLVATSNRQCVDSITKSVTVHPQPAIPTITGVDEFCTGASIVLNTNAASARQWYRNDVLVTNGTGTSLTIQQPGDYKVSSVNANGCSSFSAVKTITENPLPQGTLNTPASLFICEGTPFTLTASGGTTYQWFLNNVAITGETAATHTTGIPGNYKVQFISDKGCRDMSANSIDLTLIKAPDAAFSYDTYCINVQTNFFNRSASNQSGIVSYSWKFGDGNTAGNTSNTSNTYARSGNFTATLLVTPNACPQLADSAQAIIAIQNPTPGIQYPPVNAIINKVQQLSARSIGNNYLWTPGTYLSSITSRTPTVNASREQLYRIIITNAAGCTTVDTQLVRVFSDRNIYVPEGFTPDNDGRNDRLFPFTVGINEMKVFRIYNRWGLLVYDNKNANVSNGWDGTYRGIKQPMETYAWVAEGIDIDGNLIRRTGNTILIR